MVEKKGGGGAVISKAAVHREGKSSVDCYSAHIKCNIGITVSATYPITVGGGGISPYTSPSHPAPSSGAGGSTSTFQQ